MRISFLELFCSNPKETQVVLRTSVQKERDKKGKLSAKYITCKRAPSENDVQVHLGKVCIVAKPELADDTCTWAMLDFDIYLDSSAVLRIGEAIDRLALPLPPVPIEVWRASLRCVLCEACSL